MTSSFDFPPLADLHAHLTASINPSIYWQIAHDLGIKLPKSNFHEFINYITLSSDKKSTLKEYLDTIYHPVLNKLSTGTHAVERATYEIMSGAYRNNITLIELRNNPMKHNNNAELDLDHIIMAMLRGMERALLEYKNLQAGIIFCLDRQFSYQQNAIIVEKAIKYRKRGVIGIDFANYNTQGFNFQDYKDIVQKAKDAGLGITVHTGETDDTNDMWEAIEYLSPARIGHGIKAAYDEKLMQEIANRKIVLEVCPLSNLATKAVRDFEELKMILQRLDAFNVLFSINTDWPEIIEDAHLWKQIDMLEKENILTKEQLLACNQTAFASSFIRGKGLEAYL